MCFHDDGLLAKCYYVSAHAVEDAKICPLVPSSTPVPFTLPVMVFPSFSSSANPEVRISGFGNGGGWGRGGQLRRRGWEGEGIQVLASIVSVAAVFQPCEMTAAFT